MKENQTLTLEPLFFDNRHIDVNFDRLMSCFCNRHMTFPSSPQFSSIAPVETIAMDEKETFFETEKGLIYNDDGSVTIHMRAPGASEVTLINYSPKAPMHDVPMQKTGDGLFSVTLSNYPGGFYYHKYSVDGNERINPLLPIGYGCFCPINFYEIPDGDDFYYMKDVPHGAVHFNRFHSDTTGSLRTALVYTPPGYRAEDKEKRYPVLYLQHGSGESEISWIWHGKAGYILDNMIASGECPEIIVVMNNGYAFTDKRQFSPLLGALEDVITCDCIPYIDSRYNTIADKSARYIAGLSMGSMQAQTIAFNRPDCFCGVGMFSGGFIVKNVLADFTEYLSDVNRVNEEYPLIFISYGLSELERTTVASKNIAPYMEKGLRASIFTTHGYHEWDVWRRSLRAFLSHLRKM